MLQIYHHIGGLAGERPVGGGAYATLLKANHGISLPKVAKIMTDIQTFGGSWEQYSAHCDDYGITPVEYYEIAKCAINLRPYSSMHLLRTEKLTANQYYDLCTIMAKHGLFQDINYDKLAQACPYGVNNPLYRIMFIALIKSIFRSDWYNGSTCPKVYNYMIKNGKRFSIKEKNALFFALWLGQRNGSYNISGNDLAGISNHTVKYVQEIIIQEIYNSSDSNFVNRLNFPSVMLDENNGMPRIVTDACVEIIKEIHKAGQERMAMKHNHRGH